MSIWLFLALAGLCTAGCVPSLPPPTRESVPVADMHKVVVMPFRMATGRFNIGTSVRCPICGAIFIVGQIEPTANAYMTRQLWDYLRSKSKYSLIPPGTAEGVRSHLLSEHIGLSERNLIVEVGKNLQADGVVSGMIYSFRQRVGTPLSVDTPASVAFDIHFLRVSDGRLIWAGHFDETQHSLSENVFRFGTFVRRGGRWLTAEELVSFGLRQVMASFPGLTSRSAK